jgi:hypothetical protein
VKTIFFTTTLPVPFFPPKKGATVIFNFQIEFSPRRRARIEKKSSTKLFLFAIRLKKAQKTNKFFGGIYPFKLNKIPSRTFQNSRYVTLGALMTFGWFWITLPKNHFTEKF